MSSLYPAIKPFQQHWLDVGDGHTLYLEESGSPDGLPVIFIHGGPGIGCNDSHRRFFDPLKYRIILFDQRGAGRSKPHASLLDNTTAHLLGDLEKIRCHLGIEKWLLFGGSWGSTLALLYAQQYSERVSGLILRGIFLCRQQDLQWFYQSGANRIFPDAWQQFIKLIPGPEQGDLIRAYYHRLTGEDELVKMAAAKAWARWEAHCATLQPSASVMDYFSDPAVALAMARIEAHYFVNQAFIEPNQILNNMNKISHLPAIIVHGRYDVICPMDQAQALYEQWPQAELDIICSAGHAASEPGIESALVKATNRFAGQLGRSA